MRKIHKNLIFPLVFLLSLTTSCGEEITKFKEYYDSSWTPGENALDSIYHFFAIYSFHLLQN